MRCLRLSHGTASVFCSKGASDWRCCVVQRFWMAVSCLLFELQIWNIAEAAFSCCDRLQYKLPRVWRSQDRTLHTFPISALSTMNQAGEPYQNKPLVWRCRSIWCTCVNEETAVLRTCFSISCFQSTFWTAAANTLHCNDKLYWQFSTVGLLAKHLTWWPPYIQVFSVYSQYNSLFFWKLILIYSVSSSANVTTKAWLLGSQESAAGPYPEPGACSPRTLINLL